MADSRQPYGTHREPVRTWPRLETTGSRSPVKRRVKFDNNRAGQSALKLLWQVEQISATAFICVRMAATSFPDTAVTSVFVSGMSF